MAARHIARPAAARRRSGRRFVMHRSSTRSLIAAFLRLPTPVSFRLGPRNLGPRPAHSASATTAPIRKIPSRKIPSRKDVVCRTIASDWGGASVNKWAEAGGFDDASPGPGSRQRHPRRADAITLTAPSISTRRTPKPRRKQNANIQAMLSVVSKSANAWFLQAPSLGDRLTVGQRTLTPPV